MRTLTLVPILPAREQERPRPLPPELAWARAHSPAVLACDGSTVDALLRKVGLLRDCPGTPLAGRMTALLDLCSRLPRQLWYEADAAAHDQRHWPQILAALPKGALVVFDLGSTNFEMFLQLTRAQVTVVTRAKSNLVSQVARVLRRTARVHELIVWIGSGDTRQQLRLIEVLWQGTWHRYLTNELDPTILPPEYAVALSWQRWRIEDAVNLVKRLRGLAYFWVGSANGVELQRWATWCSGPLCQDNLKGIAKVVHPTFRPVDRTLARIS
ncbi:MAG: transposase [Chloroflexi bacterium]|nr:transposase [Chloroflexota bacterium]